MDIYFYIIRKNSVHDQLSFPNSQLCHESDTELCGPLEHKILSVSLKL